MKRHIIFLLIVKILFSTPGAAKSLDSLSIADKIDALELKQMSAIVVQKDNEVVFEKYFEGFAAGELHNVRSASKSLTGLLFGIALEQEKFTSADEKVLNHFPDYQNLLFDNPAKQQMTFFDLLSMTGPLECDDWNNFSAGHEEKMYLQADWISFTLNLPERGHAPWEPAPQERKYGRDFSYCTAGISLTGAAIERATQQKLDDFAQHFLLGPLGITNAKWMYSPKGITQAGGGLAISAKDLLKVGQLILNNGQWDGQQIINKNWIEKSLKRYSVAMPEMNAEYGLTWWIFDFPVKEKTVTAYAAAGNGGNYLFIVPSLNMTTVIMSTAYNKPYMHQQAHQVFSQVILPALL
ncbi:serine hydrolase [Aliikangiella marina]|uniref:Serine hydrolase n=1 Tax=Aliikangiella marina TaxID=1712262 RepID=A0A545T9E0_9GAMM|nr:serine hydrolase [Aliikangiella marina]TQV73833.1 serine hydrolase [Aliikangiella marina]